MELLRHFSLQCHLPFLLTLSTSSFVKRNRHRSISSSIIIRSIHRGALWGLRGAFFSRFDATSPPLPMEFRIKSTDWGQFAASVVRGCGSASPYGEERLSAFGRSDESDAQWGRGKLAAKLYCASVGSRRSVAVSGIQASLLNFLIGRLNRSPFEGRTVSFISPTSSLTEPKSNQSAMRKGSVSLARVHTRV
jgi:hypothetical protein